MAQHIETGEFCRTQADLFVFFFCLSYFFPHLKQIKLSVSFFFVFPLFTLERKKKKGA